MVSRVLELGWEGTATTAVNISHGRDVSHYEDHVLIYCDSSYNFHVQQYRGTVQVRTNTPPTVSVYEHHD